MPSGSNMHNSNMCLIGAMDRLWFHQVILLSQPNIVSLITPQTIISLVNDEENQSQDSSFKSESPTLSTSSLAPDDEDYIDTDSSSSPSSETPKKEMKRKCERFNISRSNRSLPSLSSASRERRSRSLSRSSRLEKTMSCKSLGELELEEVKGFLDLGFTFRKEHLSPRMITLIPGLQRLDSMSEDKEEEEEQKEGQEHEQEDDDERGVIIRPYLSEAWLIRKPSSPLLSLKVPRASQASDMKKHLKFWARVVASEIQQES